VVDKQNADNDELIGTIYQTIDNPALWRSVIEQLCTITGASKGILTLRENDTAEFVVPERYAESPLYFNFDDEEVFSFITKYIDVDPWTKIENQNRSDFPYILSDHISDAELRNSKMWAWLEPQNINDTVTIEIGQTENYWAAMNLYFNNNTFNHQRELLATLKYHLPHLKKAFSLGEKYSAAVRLAERSASTIEQIKVPAALVELDGNIVHLNSKLQCLAIFAFEANETPAVLKFRNSKFQKRYNQHLVMLRHQSVVAFELNSQSENRSDSFRVTLTALGERETLLGKPMQTVLITVTHLKILSPIDVANLANAKNLSKRQTELAQFLCEGGNITGFGGKVGIGKSGAFHHWRELKTKTGVEKPHEIRVIAEKYL